MLRPHDHTRVSMTSRHSRSERNAQPMNIRWIVTALAAVLATGSPLRFATAQVGQSGTAAIETRVPVGGASLYTRAIGHGRPLIVLHGGPDFDHGYLLPDMDRLSDTYRLIYYDQRGRGKSAE